MNTTLLKEGDVINLTAGMRVYATIPSKFVYANAKLSDELTETDLIIDKKYLNDVEVSEDIKNIATKIMNAFGSQSTRISLEASLNFVNSNIKKPTQEEFSIAPGEFLVIKTENTGGGNSGNDYYPDGHRVYCKRLNNGSFDEKGTEINFYQTGSFTAMIENITPIRQMKMSFK